MKDQKQYTEGISVKESRFLRWLDNFWYHYKWVTIIVAFFTVVACVCIIQACTNDPTDILVTYAGPAYLEADEKTNIEKILTKNLPEKFASDENAKAGLSSYYILSKEQIEEAEKQTEVDEDGKSYQVYIDTRFISEEMDSFESQLMTGSGSVLLLDMSIYNSLVGEKGRSERLVSLTEILGETPKGAVGNYGIRLGDTEIYHNNPQLWCLPADTVVCLHAKILGQKDYDQEIDMFKSITKLVPSADGE